MANYLPVLLVSVAAGVPDDAAVQPLPRGQVDYLSHNWDEEDVWRSWRSMTKQKNEITNGLRLENASWRTWWKQRNKLKTISPETLNWLKDSDVTWLYGPLHTAVEWSPPKRHTALASHSSILALNCYSQNVAPTKKPILKHRSISELLTSSMPHSSSYDLPDKLLDLDPSQSQDPSPRPSPRPGLLRVKSDSTIFRRFDFRTSPQRKEIPEQRIGRSLDKGQPLHNGSRNSSSTNLASSTQMPRAPSHSHSHSPSPGLYPRSSGSGAGPRSGSSDTTSSRSEIDVAVAPTKKHISFNTFVEQCIAIEKPKPKSRSSSYGTHDRGPGRDDILGYDADDGYDEEDDIYLSDSDSDDILEMRTPSRRSSSSSHTIPFRRQDIVPEPRPRLLRSSASQPYNPQPEREHVTIAPIAPTMLKIGEGSADSPVYLNSLGRYDYVQNRNYVMEDGDSGGLVYQPPEGSIYSVPNGVEGTNNAEWQSNGDIDRRLSYLSSPAMVSSGSCDEGAEEDGFDYFQGPDLGEDFSDKRPLERGRRASYNTRDPGRGRYRNDQGSATRGLEVHLGKRVPLPDSNNMVNRGRTPPGTDNAPSPTLMNPRVELLRSGSSPLGRTCSTSVELQTDIPTEEDTRFDGSLTGLQLETTDLPRGRSLCPSPGLGYVTSGSTTSSIISSSVDSGSRSVSDTSESRGRSRTPGSSHSESERDRGRPRSRSRSSGTNSPLGSVSPHSSRPGSAVSLAGSYGFSGGNRKVSRKTAEDYMNVIARGERGRNRRATEDDSLSPPSVTGPHRGRGDGRGVEYRAYSVSSFGLGKGNSTQDPTAIWDRNKPTQDPSTSNSASGFVRANEQSALPSFPPDIVTPAPRATLHQGPDPPLIRPDDDPLHPSIAGRAADIVVSSARGLFGSLWNSTVT